VYASALKNTISEIRNICPEVLSSFAFKDSDLIANDGSTSEKKINQVISALNSIGKEAKTIGNLQSVRIQGTKGLLNLSCTDKLNLTTVISSKADEDYVNTLTKVLVPTVIKLVDEIQVASPKIQPEIKEKPSLNEELPQKDNEISQRPLKEIVKAETPAVIKVEPPPNEEVEIKENMVNEFNTENKSETSEIIEKSTVESENSPFLSEPPVTQLIVEQLSGILVPSDTVRIDKEIIEKWNELYEDKNIQLVHIENVNGKSTQTKFRNIKSSKHAGKGVIRIPKKIQIELETSKGELVTIKPVIE
jgi:hypothetical protein